LEKFEMKKSLVALAVLAATGAAFAQSSVSISGRLDLGSASVKTTTTNAAGVAASSTSTDLTGNQNGRTGSRLTFSGVEDLGGGLKAGFNIETGLNPSDNAPLFAGNTRPTNLFLAGGFGTFLIGTFNNAFDDIAGYSAATYSAPGGDFLANTVGTSGGAGYIAMPTRSRNAVAYVSPAFGGGFSASLGMINQDNVATSVIPGGTSKEGGYIAAIGYANGPLTGKLATANVTADVSATGAKIGSISETAFAVSYNLGVAKPYMQYAKTTQQDAASVSYNVSAYEIGATFPMGAFTPFVTVSRASGDLAGVAAGDANGYQLGATYDLSKRTSVYGNYGARNMNIANSVAKTELSGYALGLIHKF